MLLVSCLLHGLFLLAIIVGIPWLTGLSEPPKEKITKVKLVDQTASPPAPEKLDPASATFSQPAAASSEEPRLASAIPVSPPKETIKPLAPKIAPAEQLTLKKRKTPPKRVSPKPRKKTDQPPATPAERNPDPQSVIDRRLAAIRADLEKHGSRLSTPGNDLGTSDSPEGSNRGADGEETLARWIDEVRRRINARWSVFEPERRISTQTVIGLKIADDGSIIHAAVDQSSGDQVFDRSALRAVYQAAPFPPVPPEVRERIQTAGGLALRFAPGGMQ